jgi:hypothetical protein
MSERSELRSRREERMEMALKIRLGARLFLKTLSHKENFVSVASSFSICYNAALKTP